MGLPWAKGTERQGTRARKPTAVWGLAGRLRKNDPLSFGRVSGAETGQRKAMPAIPSQNSSQGPKAPPASSSESTSCWGQEGGSDLGLFLASGHQAGSG